MTLWVHAYCGYPSYAGSGAKWKRDDYDAWTLVHAAKGHDVKGFAKLKNLRGGTVTVDQSRRGAARMLFGEWSAARLARFGIRDALLIAIPASDCLAYGADKKGAALASAVASRYDQVKADSALRWVKKLVKASEGGSRDVATLRANMRMRAGVPPKSRIVLVDDVVTTGGHAKAAAALLRSYGHTVEHVLTVAHTVQVRPTAGMFAIEPWDLEADPFADW